MNGRNEAQDERRAGSEGPSLFLNLRIGILILFGIWSLEFRI